MSLENLSRSYKESAKLLRDRLTLLRAMARQTQDPEEKYALNHRINTLAPILTEMNDLEELTRRYYERGYWRNEKYTL